MKKYRIVLVVATYCCSFLKVHAQQQDSVKTLSNITINGYQTVNGVGHLLQVKDGVIYAGKKNEVIVVDSLDANKAINNTRQILGRIPGLNIAETESGGFTANGIATRGLNPIQSIEMNTRQNGYNISADVYGYNEAYYLPAMEGVKRIEMVRGAASLQFGAQFGGLVNYITESAPADKKFQFTTSQTTGSFGLFNSFNAIGGNYKKISYYGFVQYRNIEGYRENSRQWQLSGFGKLQYNINPKLTTGIEYSFLRNRIQMPGGLTDSQFAADSKLSTRARNWLKSPWNILNHYINYTASGNTNLAVKTTYIFSNRSLVWRNEDGGAAAADDIDPATGQFVPREVEKENMHSITSEARLSTSYKTGDHKSTFAAGMRFSYGWFKRLGGGEGTTNSDFDLSISGEWEYNFDFTTTNFAPFAENIFRIGKKLTVTPGIRVEFLNNTALGYKIDEIYKQSIDQSKNRFFVLGGIGIEYKPTVNGGLYANISQSYRPIDYSQLEPFGVTARIDPALKDAKGFNADAGYRTVISNYFNTDLSIFYLAYNNRIGTVVKKDGATGEDYAYRTNIANSVHKGIETYAEFNIIQYLHPHAAHGLSIFNSFAYIDAAYTSGEFKGKRVEAAARIIERAGVIYTHQKLSATFQVNYTGDAYGDASNARTSDDPVAGYIPAYTVLDASATYKFDQYAIKIGLNNIGNSAYFTRRTDEYPGPGIIPAIGRSFYLGFTAKL